MAAPPNNGPAAGDPRREAAIVDENRNTGEEEDDDQEQPGEGNVKAKPSAAASVENQWAGWPGLNVYRLVVPSLMAGAIIGRKGEFIKKIQEETRAKIRIVTPSVVSIPERVVVISAKEEPELDLSPAMDAVMRISKHVIGITEDGSGAVPQPTNCEVKLMTASTQAISLIGKQGATIKAIQESSGAFVRVIFGADLPPYVPSDERLVSIQGDASRVLIALEAVIGHLRKFLVDKSILPLFDQSFAVAQDHYADTTTQPAEQISVGDYAPSIKRDPLVDRGTSLDSQYQRGGLYLYGQDPSLTNVHSSGLGRSGGGALVTQITQTMQIPLSYAEDIIGIQGSNIHYIRNASGALISVNETPGAADEITVEIRGTSSQVQAAHNLVQEFIRGRKEPAAPSRSAYGSFEERGRSTYPQVASSAYTSSLSGQSLGGYASSGYGGYGSYRY